MINTKRRNSLILTLLFFCGCGLKDQADQLKALENCSYAIESADSVYLARTDITDLVNNRGFDFLQAPQLALAYLQKSVPLNGILNVKITNNGQEEAGINQFEYKVLLRDTEVLSGLYSNKIQIKPQSSVTIPITIDKDIYSYLSDRATRDSVIHFFTSTEQKSVPVTFRVKPGFLVGNEIINYPDFIDIRKDLTNVQIKEYLSRKE